MSQAKKALTQSDIAHKAQRWAGLQKQIDAIQAEREKRLAPIHKKFDEQVDPLQAKADAIAAEVTGWLDSQKKSVTVESKNAVAEVTHGSKLGARMPDVKKLQALCKKKSVEFKALLAIVLKKADDLLGKKEVDAISTRPSIPTKTVSLRLKD